MDGLLILFNEDFFGYKRYYIIFKLVKVVYRILKCISYYGYLFLFVYDIYLLYSGDVRYKRVWKVCERCRMKKIKVGFNYLLI